ncbi:uncharacterized protein LOC134202267 [Armigeres subalbatus]|uniref:uncharacterized protein LOC134202267 n=1 Tax=Armigeres subalbatus TaxID=124917 RepID=UPI002ECFE0A5
MNDSSHSCRLCLLPVADDLSADEVFPSEGFPNQTLITMIYQCTSIRIDFHRDYSCVVCNQCIEMLEQFHSYRERCLENDLQLRQMRCDDESSVDDDPLEVVASTDNAPLVMTVFQKQIKQQIRGFLDEKVNEIERKALDMATEAIRSQALDDANGSSVDWKSKYVTLQRNNELLQTAFRNQKAKLKQMERALKGYENEEHSLNSSSQIKYETTAAAESDGQQNGAGFFTVHRDIPEISTELMQNLNNDSGPGEKGDRQFISKLAVAVFGEKVLLSSSVTGRPSNSHNNIPPKPPLCPRKVAAIGAKLFERVEHEVGRFNQKELMQRASDKVVRLVVCQKSANLRKQALKRNQTSGNNSLEDDDNDYTPRPRVKRRVQSKYT